MAVIVPFKADAAQRHIEDIASIIDLLATIAKRWSSDSLSVDIIQLKHVSFIVGASVLISYQDSRHYHIK